MQASSRLRDTILIATLCHLFFIGSISFTFIRPNVSSDEMKIVFLGPLLTGMDFYQENKTQDKRPLSKTDADLNARVKEILKPSYLAIERGLWRVSPAILKPSLVAPLMLSNPNSLNNSLFTYSVTRINPARLYRPNAPLISMYFKDRPASNIELKYSLSNVGRPIFIQRLLSTGNLEADLLVVNYLKHWIFLPAQVNNDSYRIKFYLSEFR